MVLQILPNAWKIVLNLDAMAFERGCGSNARHHQKVRRSNSTGAEDHRSFCADRHCRAVGPQIIHSDCAPAVEPNSASEGSHPNVEIGSAADRPQIGVCGAVAPAAMLRRLHGSDPLERCTGEIRIGSDATRHGGLDEQVGEWM